MAKLDISLDRWLPDLPPFAMKKGGLTICKNILPLEESFKIMQEITAYSSNTVSGTPLTAIEVYASNGNYYTFIGTTTKLYRLEIDKSLTDITRTSGNYTTSGNRWYFAKYGEWIVATNFNDEVQVLKGMTAANFEPLYTTETFKAKYVVQNHGYLMFGYYTRNGVTYPNGVIWTAKDTITDLTESAATGADSVNLEECPSPISGMTVFESTSAGYESNIAIFHRNTISAAWFVQDLFVFHFDYNRYVEVGAIEGSPILVEGICYFYDEKTFWKWDGVSTPQDIGLGVRQTILNYLDISNYYRTTTASHPRYGLAVWSIISTGKTDPDKIIILNTRNGKFALIEKSQYCVFSMHRAAWTINGLATYFPRIHDIPYPVNSNFWSDNSSIFGCISTDSKVSVFQGAPMEWIVETGEVFTDKKEVIRTRRICPMIQKRGATVTVSIGSRMEKDDDVVYASANIATNGYADIRAFGKYIRVKMSGRLHDGFTGIDVEGKVIGRK